MEANARKKDKENTTLTQTIIREKHKDNVLSQLNKYRSSGHLCDVTIVVEGGRKFPAHRNVLAAGGGFFGGLFAAKMKEQERSEIQVSTVHPDVMESMLGYIYTGEIEVTQENAQLILVAADFLLLEKLKKRVDHFMTEIVRKIACDYLAFYQFAIRYKCKSLELTSWNVMMKKFEDICKSEEFLELESETLLKMLSSDKLVGKKEEAVFEALLKWVKHKREERKDMFPKLFSHIRLCSISADFIASFVLTEDLVSSNPECSKRVLQSMKYNPATANEQQPRNCLDTHTSIILIFPQLPSGGITAGPWCFDPNSFLPDYWHHMSNPYNNHQSLDFTPCYGYGTPVYHDGAVYLIGKTTLPGSTLRVSRYDLQGGVTSEVATFPKHAFGNSSVGYLNGKIYIIGGEIQGIATLTKTVSDVYTFDFATGGSSSLKTVRPMIKSRKNPLVAADGKHLYVLGGQDYTTEGEESHLQSLERYDPLSDSWEQMAPMASSSTKGAQCATAKGKIFLVLPQQLGHEVYDIQSNSWTKITDEGLPHSVAYGVLAACDDQLYLIGCGSFNELDRDDYDDELSKCELVACKAEIKDNSYRHFSYAPLQTPWLPTAHSFFPRATLPSAPEEVMPLGGVVVRIPYEQLYSLESF